MLYARRLILAFGVVFALGVLPAAAADKFGSYDTGLSGPAVSGFAVTKSDSTVFAQPTRALYVGGTGDVAVRMLDGTTPIFSAVPAGALLPIRVDKVLSTGTSATNIVGLY